MVAILDSNVVPTLLQLQHAVSETTDYALYFDIKKPLFTDTDWYAQEIG